MKFQILTTLILVSGVFSTLFSGGMSFYASDQFYQFQDQFDSTRSQSEHYTDFGIAVTDLGGSGLSLHSDAFYTNAMPGLKPDGITRASVRQPFELTTAYLGWQSAEGGTDLKLGRQQFTNLAVDAFDFDGLGIALQPNKAFSCNFGGGLILPTPFYINGNEKKSLLANPGESGLFFGDFNIFTIPNTVLIGALALEKSLHGESAFRAALGTIVEPTDYLKIDGTGRFSTAVKGFDHLDARITVLPSSSLSFSTWFLSEKDRVDSTNYFSILMHDQLSEFGAQMEFFPDGGGSVLGGYSLTSVKNEGIDHFFFVNASKNTYLDGGITFGIGYHGMTVQPRGGFSFPMLKIFTLKGSAEYYMVDETDDDGTHHLISFSGGLKTRFPFGLTIYPRAEYITNRYYSQDVRFLITSTLYLHKFWRSR